MRNSRSGEGFGEIGEGAGIVPTLGVALIGVGPRALRVTHHVGRGDHALQDRHDVQRVPDVDSNQEQGNGSDREPVPQPECGTVLLYHSARG